MGADYSPSSLCANPATARMVRARLSLSRRGRITSYNVCYTKLLRVLAEHEHHRITDVAEQCEGDQPDCEHHQHGLAEAQNTSDVVQIEYAIISTEPIKPQPLRNARNNFV